MKRVIAFVLFALYFLMLPGCTQSASLVETTAAESTPETTWVPPETVCTQPETTAATVSTESVPIYNFTDEEEEMLLKIGMAELGNGDCIECIALVMRTILNRVEADRFGKSIRGVLFAQDQFTPVMDGTYYSAEPNALCYEALDMVIHGWDESQGALYYEFCEGESWHSKNLNLLFQHCKTRFYN